jgi:GntR family transcriptional regulator
MTALDRPLLPLYYRVFKTLEQRIKEQHYAPGRRLPSEDELCREFHVSRMTIRQAVGGLVERGLVTRRRGSGTYVGAHGEAPEFRAISFTGALEDLFAQVDTAHPMSVEMAEKAPPADVRARLSLADDEPVTVLRRVRAFGEVPFALTVNYVPRPLGPRLTAADVARMPLLQVFEQRLGVRFTHAEQTVEARLADEDVAAALRVKFGDPVLFVERLMYAGPRRIVEIVRSWYRADVYRYEIRLVRRRTRFSWSRAGKPAPARAARGAGPRERA